LLAEPVQRQAELEQAVGGLAALREVTIARQESLRRLLVVAPHGIGFAEPILRIAGEAVVAVLPEEVAEADLGVVELAPEQAFIGPLIDGFRIARGRTAE